MRDEAEHKTESGALEFGGRRCRDAEGVTVTVNGRPQNSIMRWDYVSQDTARVTRVRTGDIYYVYRCPG